MDSNAQAETSASAVDVAALRTETAWITSTDHFCAVCECFKSGWVDMPNRVTDWCENLACPCHDETS